MNRIFAIAALLVAVEIRASVVPPDVVAEELLKTELGFPSGSCACNEADNSELAALRAAKDSLSKALAAAKKAEFDAEQARLLRNAAFFKLGPWFAEKIASLFSFGAAKLLTPWINKFLWLKIGDVGPDAEELVTGLSDSIMDGISEWNENAALAGKTKIDVGKTDDVYSFVSWLGEMWEKAFEGFEIGEKVAAAKFTAEKAEDARAALQKKIDELETLLYK